MRNDAIPHVLKSLGFTTLLVLASPCLYPVQAEPAQLRPATNLYAGAAVLNPGTYAIPCVADWNGDGRKDLLVGYRLADKIAVFLNVGTESQPVLTNSFNLQAGGADIVVVGQSCGAPAPWVRDYDRDGRRDVLVGEGASPGRVYFFANTNTDAQPKLAPGVLLTVGASPLSVSYRATPYVHDWDEDGRPDLLCGNGDGNVFFFRNTNATGLPAYSAPVQIQAAGQPLSLDARAVARVCDWDGDGLKDLVGSSSTGVYWCRNTGANSAPVLAARVAISAPVSGSGLVPIYTSFRMRLDLVDWNNDGVVDLLLGNADGTVAFFAGYRFRFTKVAPVLGGGLTLQWQSAPYLKYNILAGNSPEAISSVVGANLPSGGNLTSWTNTTAAERKFYRSQIAP